MRVTFFSLVLASAFLGASASPAPAPATTLHIGGPGPAKCPQWCIECESGSYICGCEMAVARCPIKQVGPVCIEICITCKDGAQFCGCDAENHKCL